MRRSSARKKEHAATPHVHRILASRVVTIARNAPLNEAGWRQRNINSEKEKEIYFLREGWTAQISLKPLAKSVFPRRGFASDLGSRG
jgi:hypothetical protein